MKKTSTKKAISPKKTKTVAKKKSLKTGKKKTPQTSEKSKYPLWTMPEHLTLIDHKDLKRFYELFTQGELAVAFNFASNLDTIVRDEIPHDIWKKCGGKLTPKGEEELKSAKRVSKKDKSSPPEPVSFEDDTKGGEEEKTRQGAKQGRISANIVAKGYFVLKNGKMQAISGEYNTNGNEMNEAKFHKKSELVDFLLENHKTLFGKNSVLIDNTKSTSEYFPNMFLFDFNEREKPRMYIIEINFADDSLGLLYARITHFISSLKNRNYHQDFITELCKIIHGKNETKSELIPWLFDGQEIPDIFSELLENKPAILLVRDNENVVLKLMQDVYVETWGKMVRQILIKMYYCGDDKIYSSEPNFADIWKTEKSKTDKVKCNEADHLEMMPEKIRNIYNEIKSALLETDSSLEFNPKKHYISVRKNKNLAFLHLRRKNIDIVVMSPEDETRKQIKHHRIKTLPASVQKFWNGACCTIVIENAENLDEVLDLLKIVVKNA